MFRLRSAASWERFSSRRRRRSSIRSRSFGRVRLKPVTFAREVFHWITERESCITGCGELITRGGNQQGDRRSLTSSNDRKSQGRTRRRRRKITGISPPTHVAEKVYIPRSRYNESTTRKEDFVWLTFGEINSGKLSSSTNYLQEGFRGPTSIEIDFLRRDISDI